MAGIDDSSSCFPARPLVPWLRLPDAKYEDSTVSGHLVVVYSSLQVEWRQLSPFLPSLTIDTPTSL